MDERFEPYRRQLARWQQLEQKAEQDKNCNASRNRRDERQNAYFEPCIYRILSHISFNSKIEAISSSQGTRTQNRLHPSLTPPPSTRAGNAPKPWNRGSA